MGRLSSPCSPACPPGWSSSRGDRRRPPPQAGGVWTKPAPADRDGRGRGARRAPAWADDRHAGRARRAKPRPQELDVGDEPLAAGGPAARQGDEAGDAAAARPRRPLPACSDLRPRGCPKCARAGLRAAYSGARRRRRGREGAAAGRSASRSLGSTRLRGGPARAGSTRRASERDTRRRRRRDPRPRASRRGSGRTRSKEDRLDGRLAAAVMGIQAVKGVEIGEGFALAPEEGLRGTRRDRG